MGSGKTLSLVRQAYHYYLEGFKVLSNMKLNFPYTQISSKDIMEFAKNQTSLYDTVIVIDEMHIFLDSRRSASKKNLMGSYFVTQTRKQKVKLLGTTQHRHQVDRRVRDNTTLFVDCQKIDLPMKNKHGVPYILITNHMNSRSNYEKVSFIGNKYFSLYDTEEIIFDDTINE